MTVESLQLESKDNLVQLLAIMSEQMQQQSQIFQQLLTNKNSVQRIISSREDNHEQQSSNSQVADSHGSRPSTVEAASIQTVALLTP